MIIVEDVKYLTSVNGDLDYLSEYLIEKGGISLREAQELMYLVEAEAADTVKKLEKAHEKKMGKMRQWFRDAIASAKKRLTGNKLTERVKKLKDDYRIKKGYAEMELKKGKIATLGKIKRMRASIKAARGVSPKSVKIGAPIAAAAITAGGLAAYRARKKRREALGK